MQCCNIQQAISRLLSNTIVVIAFKMFSIVVLSYRTILIYLCCQDRISVEVVYVYIHATLSVLVGITWIVTWNTNNNRLHLWPMICLLQSYWIQFRYFVCCSSSFYFGLCDIRLFANIFFVLPPCIISCFYQYTL